jgi:hypothetical protein
LRGPNRQMAGMESGRFLLFQLALSHRREVTPEGVLLSLALLLTGSISRFRPTRRLLPRSTVSNGDGSFRVGRNAQLNCLGSALNRER